MVAEIDLDGWFSKCTDISVVLLTAATKSNHLTMRLKRNAPLRERRPSSTTRWGG